MFYEFLFLIIGGIVGCLLLEPLIINYIYFSNIHLFTDIILSKKNKEKLKEYYKNLKY